MSIHITIQGFSKTNYKLLIACPKEKKANSKRIRYNLNEKCLDRPFNWTLIGQIETGGSARFCLTFFHLSYIRLMEI